LGTERSGLGERLVARSPGAGNSRDNEVIMEEGGVWIGGNEFRRNDVQTVSHCK